MTEFMIVYHFLSTFAQYLFEFDEILLKNIDGKNQKAIELLAEMNTDNIFTVEVP